MAAASRLAMPAKRALTGARTASSSGVAAWSEAATKAAVAIRARLSQGARVVSLMESDCIRWIDDGLWAVFGNGTLGLRRCQDNRMNEDWARGGDRPGFRPLYVSYALGDLSGWARPGT